MRSPSFGFLHLGHSQINQGQINFYGRPFRKEPKCVVSAGSGQYSVFNTEGDVRVKCPIAIEKTCSRKTKHRGIFTCEFCGETVEISTEPGQ